MCDLLSVVIPTHNRPKLLFRAIESVYASGTQGTEIVVVDDCSTESIEEQLRQRWPDIHYLRLAINMGPGAARNAGLTVATRPWVVMLDDDDTLRPESLPRISRCIEMSPQLMQYPCIQFACTNGSLDRSFKIITLADYLTHRISGDFVPVIQVGRFLDANLRYPDLRIGGEHLLWFQIAKQYGIPSWDQPVCDLGSGSRIKLCSTANQLARASEYAQLSELSLALFGADMLDIAPRHYLKCAIGAATYRLLAGDLRTATKSTLKLAAGPRLLTIAFIAMTLPWPVSTLRRFFQTYRSIGGQCGY